MTDKEYDKSILAEARRQREHELALAEVERDREANRLREQRLNRRARRDFLAVIFVLLAVLVFIMGIGYVAFEDSKADRNQQIIESCIKAGNAWADGDCIPTKKEQ